MLIIRNWDKHYETNDTRKLKTLHWVKIPNQQDSLAYRLIAGHKRGAEIFAAWVLIVQVASKGERENRGKIPLSPDELGIVTGFPAEIFKLAIDFLKSPKIGWIEQSPGSSGENPDELGKCPARRNGREEKEEKENYRASRSQPKKHPFEQSPIFDKAEFRKAFPDWDDAKCRRWYESAIAYSGANGGRYLDWKLAIANWERKDSEKNSTPAPKPSPYAHLPRIQ